MIIVKSGADTCEFFGSFSRWYDISDTLTIPDDWRPENWVKIKTVACQCPFDYKDEAVHDCSGCSRNESSEAIATAMLNALKEVR